MAGIVEVGQHTGTLGAVISTTAGSKMLSVVGKHRAGIDQPDVSQERSSLVALLVGIMITLVVFVLIVSLYDLIKETIIVRETQRLGSDATTFPEQLEVAKMNAAAAASYNVAVSFTVVAFAIAVLLLPPLFALY